MAYTYDEFVNAARTAGLYDTFSQDDLTVAQRSPEYGLSLLKLQQDAGNAKTEEQKLLVQEAVNQLRNTYGTTLPAAQPAGSFGYGREETYQDLLQGTAYTGGFQYDHRNDAAYGDMKDQWIADNDRTGSRVTGAGTVPQTSWAQTAAQQSGNYADAKVNDQLPGMRQNAYQQYLEDYNKGLSQFGAVASDRNFHQQQQLQQQQLQQAAAQQKFENDLLLHQNFGTEAPAMPDLESTGQGKELQYTYGGETEYQKALDSLLEQEQFGYDRKADPLYASLRKTQLREGDRAAADLLAELSARTGGVASSYGVRAAADVGNAYNEALNGQIPTMQQNAYQEYLGDFDARLAALQALQGDRETDYAGYLQNYQLQEQAKQQSFQNAIALAGVMGLTPEIAAALGIPYTQSGDYSYGPWTPPEEEEEQETGTGLTKEQYMAALAQAVKNNPSGNKLTALISAVQSLSGTGTGRNQTTKPTESYRRMEK